MTLKSADDVDRAAAPRPHAAAGRSAPACSNASDLPGPLAARLLAHTGEAGLAGFVAEAIREKLQRDT